MNCPSILRPCALSKYRNAPLTDAGVGSVFGSSAGYAAARIAVRMRPGFTLFTRIFGSPCSSSASMLRTDSRPLLATAYAPVRPGLLHHTAADEYDGGVRGFAQIRQQHLRQDERRG